MKNSSDIIGNRTRDLPACSAAPQSTAPPRAPINSFIYFYKQEAMLSTVQKKSTGINSFTVVINGYCP